MALILIAEVVMTDDTAMLVLGIVLAGSGIVLGVREVLQVYWNRCLAFAITPEKLTLLWNGQPVKVIPWGEVIEIFASPGPCERMGDIRHIMAYISACNTAMKVGCARQSGRF